MITADEQMCENCEERAATHFDTFWLCNECDPEWKAREKAREAIARLEFAESNEE